MRQYTSDPSNTGLVLVTHYRPHIEEVVALTLVYRHALGHPAFAFLKSKCDISFAFYDSKLHRECTVIPGTPFQLLPDGTRFLCIGVGGGELDEHGKVGAASSAQLVAEMLGCQDRQEVGYYLRYVNRRDQGRDQPKSPMDLENLFRPMFELHTQREQQQLIRIKVFIYLLAEVMDALEERNGYPDPVFEQFVLEGTGLRLRAASVRHEWQISVAQNMNEGCQVLIAQVPPDRNAGTYHIRVERSLACRMPGVVKALRIAEMRARNVDEEVIRGFDPFLHKAGSFDCEVEGLGCWHLYAEIGFVSNGCTTHPLVDPSKLELEEVTRIVRESLEAQISPEASSGAGQPACVGVQNS